MPDYRRQIIARIQAYFATRGNARGGQLPGDPSEVEQLLQNLLPDFAITLRPANPPYLLTRMADNRNIGGIDELSSGEAQIVSIGLDVLTIAAIWDIEQNPQRIMLVDEPDAHIHPDLQVRFADFLVRVAERSALQIVVATHSTTLLAALGQFAGTDASVIYLSRNQAEVKAETFTATMKEMAACLGGHALMGALFSVPLLLVEGDDDYRIWSQVPRHHVANLAAIPANGDEIKGYQRALEKMFAAIRDVGSGLSGYTLIDGDKAKPQDDANTPQHHIRYIQLNCHEAENLYLTDEVLTDIGVTWQDAVTKIVAAANQGAFGNKSGFLSAIGAIDRRVADIKSYIREIARTVDTKNVDWTLRVGQTVGRRKPTGQLADFLGAEVIEAFWHGSST